MRSRISASGFSAESRWVQPSTPNSTRTAVPEATSRLRATIISPTSLPLFPPASGPARPFKAPVSARTYRIEFDRTMASAEMGHSDHGVKLRMQ